jgi:hypothetical protein
MRINRPLLYGGAFLVAVGGVLVVADAGGVDSAALADVLRVWPVAIVAIGAGLVLRRTRLGIGGGLLAAAMPGLLLGSGLAILPRFPGDCGVREEPAISHTETGTFAGPASVAVRGGCGWLEVSTQPGSGWRFDSGNSAGRIPTVGSDATSLAISAGRAGRDFLTAGRDRWALALPTSRIDDLALAFNAGNGQVNLAGADVGHLEVVTNLAAVSVDAAAASIDSLALVSDWSELSITLPGGSDLVASIELGGGELRVCAPPGLGLSVDTRGPGREVTAAGVEVPGGNWSSPDFETAPYRTNLDVEASFAVVAINPIGGCK